MQRFPVRRPLERLAAILLAAMISACGQLPRSGPTTEAVQQSASAESRSGAAQAVQIVEINESVSRRLAEQKDVALFSDTDADPGQQNPLVIGSGDVLETTIWESPPAALFGTPTIDPRVMSTAGATTLPGQMVDRDGYITVPFAGRIHAAGMTPSTTAAAIKDALKGKANQPQVLVRVVQNASATVAVVGEVNANVRMPLSAAGERLLDALAAAGGVRQPMSKVAIQLTRGQQLRVLPLEQVVRDPRQNIVLRPGDVVAALFQPQSFTALGATGRQEEIPFEAQGITLAQALGRVGGLIDSRSDVRGVFIFRFEPKSALAWPADPVVTTPDGQVPVIYRLDMGNPASFFAMQSFPMHHKDILFVSNSPVADLQKFLNVALSITYPILNVYRSVD